MTASEGGVIRVPKGQGYAVGASLIRIAHQQRAAVIADDLIRYTWREALSTREKINLREIAEAAALAALAEGEAR